MSLPPMFLKLVFAEGRKRGFRLWIPIFLLLPFIYLFLCAVACLFFLVNINRKSKFKTAIMEPFRMFNATKGLAVDVVNDDFKCIVSVT